MSTNNIKDILTEIENDLEEAITLNNGLLLSNIVGRCQVIRRLTHDEESLQKANEYLFKAMYNLILDAKEK